MGKFYYQMVNNLVNITDFYKVFYGKSYTLCPHLCGATMHIQ